MLNLIGIAVLLAQTQPQPEAKDPVDGSQFNYYGDDQQKPQPRPQPIARPPPQIPQDDWKHRVHGSAGQPPPPPRYEQPGGPHAANTVWITGYWMPNGYEHQWVPGHWAYPPAPGYAWEAPRWENFSGV